MKLEIAPGKIRYCGQMARLLRVEHALGLMQRGINIHAELRAKVTQSYYCRAAFLDGHLVAMWGAEGSLFASVATVWLVLSQYALKFPVTVLRTAKEEIELIAQSKQMIGTTVMQDDEAALRLVAFLGFEAPDGFGGGPARDASHRRNLIRYMKQSQHLLVQVGSTSQVGWIYNPACHRS